VLTETDVQWLSIGAVIAGDQPYAIMLEYPPFLISSQIRNQNPSHVTEIIIELQLQLQLPY
jgi:hypothetical protein